MIYADSITKNFFSYGQPRNPTPGSEILEYQDPTYLGFQWRILSTQDLTRGSDMDYFPQGLFLPDEDTDSAVSYFVRTNQLARANMIREFKKGFIALLKEAPWYFTKVTGLADIWKITPGNSYRGKEKKLTIETEEAIDLKITYLMDLYRKAVFDPGWMRYALPENQRMFTMELVVAEIRPMQVSLSSYNSMLSSSPYDPGFVLSDINGLFGNALSQDGRGSGATPEQNGIRAPWSTTTFLSFKFEQCTFDVFGSSPNYLESVGKTPDTKAVNNIVINTPFISEVNTYGLLGAVLKESYYNADYAYNIKDLNEGRATTIADTLGGRNPGGIKESRTVEKVFPDPSRKEEPQSENVFSDQEDDGGEENENLGSVYDSQQEGDSEQENLGSVYGPPPGGGGGDAGGGGTDPFAAAAARLGQSATNFAANFVESLVNQAGLGNVYTGSPFTAIGALQGFVNNPFATTQALIQQFTQQGSAGGSGQLGNIGLTGEEVELITSFIGIALHPPSNNGLISGDIGNAVEDDVVKNPNLVVGSIGKAVEDGVNQNPNLVVGNLPKGILTGPSIVRARLGNIYRG